MDMAWFNLIMDGLVAVLLLAAVPSFFMLSRRIRNMQMGQDGMRQLIEALNVATEQARRAIGDLRLAASHSAQDLEAQIKASREMADELALMVDTGNKLADRLENALSSGRLVAAGQPAAQARNFIDEDEFLTDSPDDDVHPVQSAGRALRSDGGRSEGERDLMKALKTIR